MTAANFSSTVLTRTCPTKRSRYNLTRHDPIIQCCGSAMIYSGPSFEFSEFRIHADLAPDPIYSFITRVLQYKKSRNSVLFICSITFSWIRIQAKVADLDLQHCKTVLKSRNFDFRHHLCPFIRLQLYLLPYIATSNIRIRWKVFVILASSE